MSHPRASLKKEIWGQCKDEALSEYGQVPLQSGQITIEQILVAWIGARVRILPECSIAAGRSATALGSMMSSGTHDQPAGKVPMLDAQRAIQRGLVEPNDALFPVQDFHQLVVV